MEITWIVTAILGLLIIYLLYNLANRNMDYWDKLGISTRKPLPIFGNMFHVALGMKTLTESVKENYNYFKGKKYYGCMFFQNPVFLIRDPELINQILVKDFTHFEDRFHQMDENLDLNNASLPNISGDKWRVLRHKLTPTFTSGKMKIMFNQMKECSEEVVRYLKGKEAQDFEARNLMFKFIINVIGNISFGIKVDALNDETEKDNEFYQKSVGFFKPSIATQFKILLVLAAPKIKDLLKLQLIDESVTNFFEKLTKDMLRLREKDNVKRNDFLQLMIEQRKIEQSFMANEGKPNTKSFSEDSETHQDAEEPEDTELLNLLKQVKREKNFAVFSDRIIAGQTFVFISGGSETAAAVLSFALYELSVNKDIQKRLQEEIDTILKSQELNYEAIKKMTYMDQVLNEVMRMRPPGGILGRVCTEDYKLPGTDVVIKKGTAVQIPVVGLHYDSEYFTNPEKFDPDRFQNMDAIPKGVFFPFGGGPRICIAMRLAMLEMKVVLATLLSSYNVIFSNKTQTPLKMNKKSILQHVVGGIWVRFEPRN